MRQKDENKFEKNGKQGVWKVLGSTGNVKCHWIQHTEKVMVLF